jgi:hypothetical protein
MDFTVNNMRPPPSYATFASDDLANSAYFGLNVSERGLLDSMMRAWWVEHRLPRQAVLLARVLRLDVNEVTANLSAAVLCHFVIDQTDSGLLHPHELVRQYRNIQIAREKMSIGGMAGAMATNSKRDGRRKPRRNKTLQQAPGYPASNPATYPSGSGRRPELNCNERTELQSLEKQPINNDDWVNAYELAEPIDLEAEQERLALQSPNHH